MDEESKFEVDDWQPPLNLKKDPAVEKIETQLQKWAHEGTKEALDKLNDFIDKKENKDLRWYAKMSRDECELCYYDPRNDQEEKDLLLARMAANNEETIFDLVEKIDGAKYELKRLDVEEKVHQSVMKKFSAKKREEWKHNSNEDQRQLVECRLHDLEEGLDYYQALAKEARAMIRTKKYQIISARTLSHIHDQDAEVNFWGDEKLHDCGCDGGDIDFEDIPF